MIIVWVVTLINELATSTEFGFFVYMRLLAVDQNGNKQIYFTIKKDLSAVH